MIQIARNFRGVNFFQIIAAAFLSSILCSSCLAQKQTSASPTLNQKFQAESQKRTFADLITLLRKQCHISVIADGIPKRKDAALEFDGSLKAALNKIADAFDFTWTLKSSVVLLNKRFQSKGEQPQITLPEMKQMTKEIADIFHSLRFNADPRQWQPMLQNLANSFTPEQVQTLRDGQTLSASQLAFPQLDLLTQAIYTASFSEPMLVWDILQSRLENVSGSYLVAKHRSEETSETGQPPFDLFYGIRDKNGKLDTETIPIAPVSQEDQP